jgi:hypothetical protein
MYIMKAINIIELLDKNIQPVVTFNEKIDLQETEINNNMMGKIISYDIENISGEDIYSFNVDIGSFEEINTPVMSTEYYNGDGVACLTYKEAGFCKDGIAQFCLEKDESVCEIKDAKTIKLYDEYKKDTLNKSISYIDWLEGKIIKNHKYDVIDFINVINKLPHAKTNLPLEYHNKYINNQGISKPIANPTKLTQDTSDIEKYAAALCFLLNERQSDIFILLNDEDFNVCKNAHNVCNKYINKLKKKIKTP